MTYQTYLKDCGCINGGIILHEGRAVCRWCRTPYTEGGKMSYEQDHFRASKQSAEREWEIVSFYNDRAVADIPESKIINRGHSKWSYAGVAEFPIHSVKRLSDAEVFTVGDWCKHGGIKSFQIIGTGLFATFESGDVCCQISLTDLQKSKPVLFRTQDGKDMFENDKYWYVDIQWNIGSRVATEAEKKRVEQGADIPVWAIAELSSEEAAKDYVFNNRPVLSLKNVLDCAVPGRIEDNNPHYQKLKELVKSKINQ